jgi:uncharacterized protein (TIGR00661 family)
MVEKFNIIPQNSTILVAPLDWGLGHATRCIPIIKVLLTKNCTVIIAVDGAIEILLKDEFPNLLFVKLLGYNVKYSKTKALLPLKIFTQLPKIFNAINKENKWLQNIIDEYNIDYVISDNRLGLYSSKATCIYITHQLTIKSSVAFIERWMQKIHYKYINKFAECWIPDYEGENNLAGILSHPKKLPKIPIVYINPLSRFINKDLPIIYDAAIVLSGPEPQRTVFENIILNQFIKTNKKIVLVRGLPQNNVMLSIKQSNIIIYNFLNAQKLNDLLLQSNLIICRSGYSTIMDLQVLQKNAVLVPTLGQTEQEYLAKYLSKRKNYRIVEQNKFDLEKFILPSSEIINQHIYPIVEMTRKL